jgi:hypothetical protein
MKNALTPGHDRPSNNSAAFFIAAGSYASMT